MNAKNWLSLVKVSHADPDTAGLIGGFSSYIPGGSAVFPGLYSGLSNHSLGAGLRTGTRSFAENLGGMAAGGAAGGIAGLLGGLLIKNDPQAAMKLLRFSGLFGSSFGGALGAMHGAESSVENINHENSILGRLGDSISKMGNYPLEKAGKVAAVMVKQSVGHRALRPFLGDVATGAAWGIGGMAVDKGVNAVSHLFGKHKKPQTDPEQEEHKKEAIIRREGYKFVLYSHKGKVLGRHPTRAKAMAQERAIKAHGG